MFGVKNIVTRCAQAEGTILNLRRLLQKVIPQEVWGWSREYNRPEGVRGETKIKLDQKLGQRSTRALSSKNPGTKPRNGSYTAHSPAIAKIHHTHFHFRANNDREGEGADNSGWV